MIHEQIGRKRRAAVRTVCRTRKAANRKRRAPHKKPCPRPHVNCSPTKSPTTTRTSTKTKPRPTTLSSFRPCTNSRPPPKRIPSSAIISTTSSTPIAGNSPSAERAKSNRNRAPSTFLTFSNGNIPLPVHYWHCCIDSGRIYSETVC